MAKRKAMKEPELTEKHKKHFDEAINGQSGLACALIAIAFIENALMTLLSSFFLECETAKGLFRTGNSLGDLSKCADMAYCLGFITKAMLENIKKIGEVRNTFAHSPGAIDFDDPDIKSLVKQLTYPKGDRLPIEESGEKSARIKFSLVSVQLYSWIWITTMGVKRREESNLDHIW